MRRGVENFLFFEIRFWGKRKHHFKKEKVYVVACGGSQEPSLVGSAANASIRLNPPTLDASKANEMHCNGST